MLKVRDNDIEYLDQKMLDRYAKAMARMKLIDELVETIEEKRG